MSRTGPGCRCSARARCPPPHTYCTPTWDSARSITAWMPPRAVAPPRASAPRRAASDWAASWRCQSSNRARWARSPASAAVAASSWRCTCARCASTAASWAADCLRGRVGRGDGLVGGHLGRDGRGLPLPSLVEGGPGGGVGVGLVHPGPLQPVLGGQLGARDGVVELRPGHQVVRAGRLGEQGERAGVQLLLVGRGDELVEPQPGLLDGRRRGLGLDARVRRAGGRGRGGVLRGLQVDQRRPRRSPAGPPPRPSGRRCGCPDRRAGWSAGRPRRPAW